MKTLFDAGYLDFDENKVMIETNPGMTIEDIMACIDESKQENGLDLENVSAESGEEAVDISNDEEEDLLAVNNLSNMQKEEQSGSTTVSEQKKSDEANKPKKQLQMPS